jgi:hypothetical protein
MIFVVLSLFEKRRCHFVTKDSNDYFCNPVNDNANPIMEFHIPDLWEGHGI